MRIIARLCHYGAVASALLATTACAPQLRLTAAWYLVPGDDGPNPKERIVVALLNRGEKPRTIYDASLDPQPLTTPGPEPFPLAPGQLYLFDVLSAPQQGCRVPVRLYVRLRRNQRVPNQLNIAGSMPTLLPSDWTDAQTDRLTDKKPICLKTLPLPPKAE